MSSMLARLMEESCQKLSSGRLTKKSASSHERLLRAALVSADVSFAVAKSLASKTVTAALGEQTRSKEGLSRTFVGLLEENLSRPHPPRQFGGRIVLVGANGAGKTTTAAKMARVLSRTGKVAVVACDHVRAAAAEQLEAMSSQSGSTFLALPKGSIAKSMKALSPVLEAYDHVIFDTSGVQDLVPLEETTLPDIVKFSSPDWRVLVCDAAGGQQIAALAEYLSPLALDASVLTKSDGDSLGGAALTIVSTTNRPILFVGTGERVEDLEDFSPRGMASRIMGQGDLASLARRAQEVSQESSQEIPVDGKFDFNSMLAMFSAVQSMGGMAWVAKMMPGGIGKIAGNAAEGLARVEAIVLSMSHAERSNPRLLSDSSRISRIARGCGQREGSVLELVNRLESFSSTLSSLRRPSSPSV